MSLKLQMMAFGIGTLIMAVSASAWAEQKIGGLGGENAMAEKEIKDVLREHTGNLMLLPGVVGTALGLCDNRPCIKVYVTKRTPELQQKIPSFLEGYPVMIEETGEIRPLPEKQK